MHVLKLKRVRQIPDLPTRSMNAEEVDRVDLDEAMLPDDSWESDLEVTVYEVRKIVDMRSIERCVMVVYTDTFWLRKMI